MLENTWFAVVHNLNDFCLGDNKTMTIEIQLFPFLSWLIEDEIRDQDLCIKGL